MHIHVVKKERTIARMAFDKNGFTKILDKPHKDLKRSDFKSIKEWVNDNVEELVDNWYKTQHKEVLIDLGVVR